MNQTTLEQLRDSSEAKRIAELYEIMDLHPDGRVVWRAQNIELARELECLEEEFDEAEQELIYK
jgi:hypothetical protein